MLAWRRQSCGEDLVGNPCLLRRPKYSQIIHAFPLSLFHLPPIPQAGECKLKSS